MTTRRPCDVRTLTSLLLLAACSPSEDHCPSVTPRERVPLPPILTATARPTQRAALKPTSAPDETVEDLYCRRNRMDRFGAWAATPAEIRTALDRVKFVCAPTDWLAEAVSNCMIRMGQTAVTVRYGVFGGDRATPNACDVSVQTAEWKGRKWVTLACDIREDHTFFGYVTALEWTPQGPVTSSRGCARDGNGNIIGALPYLEPKGWDAFPEGLKARLCQ